MTAPTFAEASTAQTQTQIRDGLLASLAADGSAIGGLPISSPDRGLIEAEAAHLALEKRTRANVAKSLSATTAIEAGDTWVDAAATWFQVPNGTGGYGRVQATQALWIVGLVVAPAAAPVALHRGQQVQIQAVDSAHTVYNLELPGDVTMNAASSYKGGAGFLAAFPGTAGNVTPDAIRLGAIISSGVAGLAIDTGATPELYLRARDQESSTELAARCLASWGRLGAGWTKQAFDYLIPLYSPSTTQWIVRDDNPYGPGTVGVVLGDSGGVAAVSAGLNGAATRPLGSGGATVTAATPHALTVTAALANNGSNTTLHADALAALALLQGAFPLGGTLDPSLTVSLLRGDAVGDVAHPATVVMYDGTTKAIVIDAPGFGSVSAVALSGASATPVVLAWNEKLVITGAITT